MSTITPAHARRIARLIHDAPPITPRVGLEQRRARLPIKHGTRYAYRGRGCTCGLCREANNAYSRKVTERLRQVMAKMASSSTT